ncbi:hypothetical protein ASF61_16775 [Duganella sp. Leaf126]|nr:hypothetical protein ASF61_16775 [Duganella sp. Leaf126]
MQMAAAEEAREVALWPENAPVFVLFREQQTQWRTGPMGGVTGLDYTCAHRSLDRMGLTPEELDEWESDLRVMEYAALPVLNKVKE